MEETLNIITEKQYTAIKEMAKVNHRWFVGNTEYVLTYSYTGEDIILDVGTGRFYKIKLNTELSGKVWQALFIGYESYLNSKSNK
jgi:hypothetical protein